MSKYQGWGRLNNTALAIGLLFSINNVAYGGGFALNDQSVTFLGNAYTGTSSAIQDASTGYYNPAGLSELRYSQILASGTYLSKNTKLLNGTATNSLGTPIPGNNPTKPSSNLFIPAGHIAWRVSDRFSLGLSVIEPFGLDIRYSDTDIARLMSTQDKITTVDISPTFGLILNNCFSVGAGLDFLKTNTRFGSDVAWADVGPESQGFVNISGNAWSIGYHIGILAKPWCNNRMGLVYFSKFKPKFSGVVQSAQTLDFGSPTTATYSMELPDRFNYSITQYFGKKIATMAEVEWTRWSRLKTITFTYNSFAQPGIQTFNFRNTWRAGLGADFKPTKRLALKIGAGYDQSPMTNETRSAMIPDADRYLLGIGLKFAFNPVLIMTVGYSHAFYLNTNITQTGTTNAFNLSPNVDNLSTLNAQVKNAADIVGVQLSLNLYKQQPKKAVKNNKARSKYKARRQ